MAIDTHAHLEMEAFDKDREAVLERAAAAGLTAIVTVGTTLPDCEKAVALARRYAPVYAAVGIHPHEVKEIDAAAYDALRLFAREREGGRDRRDRPRLLLRQLPAGRPAPVFCRAARPRGGAGSAGHHPRPGRPCGDARAPPAAEGASAGGAPLFLGGCGHGPGVRRARVPSLRGGSRHLSEGGSAPGGGAGDPPGAAPHRDRLPPISPRSRTGESATNRPMSSRRPGAWPRSGGYRPGSWRS